jgi:hypothetical protein
VLGKCGFRELVEAEEKVMGGWEEKSVDRQKKVTTSWAPVAHAYNSSYSAVRDQEDPGSKSA